MADSVPRNLIYALRRVYTAIEQNSNCTNHMLQGVIQLLRRVYLLPVTYNTQNTEVEFERLMDNLHRWVVQWESRSHIDEEMRDLPTVFIATLDWWNEEDIQNKPNLRSEYINNVNLIIEQNPTVPQMLREAIQLN